MKSTIEIDVYSAGLGLMYDDFTHMNLPELAIN